MTLKTILIVAGAVASMGLASKASAVTVAAPEEVYTFTGQCEDCTGVGVGTLTLQGYTQGAELTASNFVSFTYKSNLLPDYVISTVTYMSGDLSPVPGQDAVLLYSKGGGQFSSQTDGFWCTGNSCLSDYGYAHVWSQAGVSAAPEPASWALMLAGAGLAGAALRSGRRKAADAANTL